MYEYIGGYATYSGDPFQQLTDWESQMDVFAGWNYYMKSIRANNKIKTLLKQKISKQS